MFGVEDSASCDPCIAGANGSWNQFWKLSLLLAKNVAKDQPQDESKTWFAYLDFKPIP